MELIPGGIIQAFLSGAALLRLLQNKCTIRGPGRARCSAMDLPRFRFHMVWHNNFQPRTSLPKTMISSLLEHQLHLSVSSFSVTIARFCGCGSTAPRQPEVLRNRSTLTGR
jgi:hypothetical protein